MISELSWYNIEVLLYFQKPLNYSLCLFENVSQQEVGKGEKKPLYSEIYMRVFSGRATVASKTEYLHESRNSGLRNLS